MTPDELKNLFAIEIVPWGPVLRDSGLKRG